MKVAGSSFSQTCLGTTWKRLPKITEPSTIESRGVGRVVVISTVWSSTLVTEAIALVKAAL